MLHYRHPVQDENSGVALKKSDPDAENAIPTTRLPGKSFGTGSKTPGLGQRKALGNITNTERKGLSAATGQKPRKALGDITNATPLRQAAGGKQQARSSGKPLQSEAKQATPRTLAEIYAEDGIENVAGKTWKQLQREQQQQDDADIAARVAAISAVPFHIPFATDWSRWHPEANPRRQAKALEVPKPPTPPPTPCNSLDLDELCGLENFMVKPPSIDWTFGGMFKDDTAVHTTRPSRLEGVVDGNDGTEADGD